MLENNEQIYPVWDFYDSITNALLVKDYTRNGTKVPVIGDQFIGVGEYGSVIIVRYELKKTKNKIQHYDVYVKRLR